ncbi:MAG: hypothetical protein JWQ09_4978 [Segetibacter sp.]|nr:hypothetical protein [Segetibacter sp.]
MCLKISIMLTTKHLNENISSLKTWVKKLRILHLEDQNSDALLISKAIKKGGIDFEMLVVDTKGKFIKALKEFSPDIILSDHSLPSFNSHEALGIFHATGIKIPFILITATMSDEFAVDIIEKGADDYILKDRLNRLPSAIHRSLEKFRLEKEREFFVDELIKKEKLYRALVENSEDAVVILNAEGKPTYVSPSVKRVLGYTENEVQNLNLFTIAHPDDVLALANKMEEVLANPGIAIKGHTGRMLHKNGSWRWIEETLTNLLHEPAINGIVNNFRDITERKLAEEEIINKEHKFRSLIENSADGMAILSASGKPTYVSPSIKNVLGYRDEEGMQLDLLTLAHPGDVASLVEMMEQARTHPGVPISGNATRMRHKNGEWRWVEGVITNMLHDPVISGFVDNFRDITERKQAEEKIIHLNRLYAFISQINQTIVHSVDEQTVFKEACRIACEIGKFEVAWIGIIDIENKKVNLVKGCGILPEDISKFSNVSYEKNGPHEYVLQTGTYYMCNDFQNDFLLEHWKPLAADKGYRSCIVLPLKKSGSIIGSFNLYSSELNFFTLDEIALLVEATGDISFVLDVFEKQKLKLQADDLIKHKELRLNQAQAIAHLGSWELSFSTGILTWSKEALRIHGLSPEESQQSYDSWISFIHPDDIDHVMMVIKEAEAALSNSSFSHRIITKDGTVKHLFSKAHFEFDSAGKPTGLYGIMHDVTEVKKAEEQLRNSESNLQAIFENTSDGFILADVNGIIKAFNNKSKDFILLNVEKEIKEGDSIFDFIHEARKENYKNSITQVLSGETLRYDYPFERKNGKTYWFNYTINPVYRQREIVGLSITSTEITERKQAEELLRRSESNLTAIIENTDASIYSLDRDFKYITFNHALKNSMKELFGLNIEPGYHVFDFIKEFDPGGVQQWNDIYSKALNGEIVKFEKEFIIKDFNSYISFSIHPIWENKNVIGLSCFANDITKEKKAEAENRFKASLLNTIGQAAVATDINGLVNYWNLAAEQIFGWTKEEAIGKNIIDLTPSHATKEQAFQIMEDLKQGRTWSGEFRVQRKDGTDFPAYVTDSPIHDQHQKIIGIIGISSDITEKKKLEELLDKANSMARIGSYELDLTNNTLYWSPITKEIHEVDNDFIPNFKTAINFYKTGSSRDSIIYAVQQAIEKGTSYDLQLQIVTAKGNERWVQVIATAQFIDGKCIKINGSFQDIDKTKRAELDLLNVYEEKNLILESINDGFYALDKTWTVTYWNKGAEILLRRDRSEMIGKNLWDEYPDMVDTLLYTYYHKAVEENTAMHFEERYATLNIWIEVNIYPSPNGLSVYLKDITEQKQAEAALKQSETRYRQIVETAQEGIWMIDENNYTSFVNKKLCDIFGYTKDEMLGKENYYFMDDEGKEIAAQLMDRKKRGETGQADFKYVSKNGREIWTNVSANSIFDNDGNYKGSLAMITDITIRKEHEIQIKKSFEERELLIRELTKSLTDLKQFSFITSHNFRAPLSNLIGLLSLIDYSTLSKMNRDIVEMFKTSTSQLNKTINDLIQILIIRNNVNVNITQNNIKALLNEVQNSLVYEINESKCIINKDLKVEVVLFNQLYLESILINLLSNAIKYRALRRPLEINISTGLNTDGKVIVTIKDNGVGIDLNRNRDKIFGLYQRFHSNSDSEGLGLFIVKTQITALGGSIDVESEVDKGTSFIITFKDKVQGNS